MNISRYNRKEARALLKYHGIEAILLRVGKDERNLLIVVGIMLFAPGLVDWALRSVGM